MRVSLTRINEWRFYETIVIKQEFIFTNYKAKD